MTIYLCGGMHNNWQDTTARLLVNHTVIDPRASELQDENEYTAWDLQGIKDADLILAYMDNDNPSGFGLNLEIGYAYALNKPIYFVCEYLGFRHKYFGMARVCASRLFDSLGEAIAAIDEDRS